MIYLRNYGRTSQDFLWGKAKERFTPRSIKGKLLLHILNYAQKVEGLSASLKTIRLYLIQFTLKKKDLYDT